MKWNKGDYVLCISQGSTTNPYGHPPKIGMIYKIHNVDYMVPIPSTRTWLEVSNYPLRNGRTTVMGFFMDDFIYLGRSNKLSRVERFFYGV